MTAKIAKVTRYVYKGKEYRTERAALGAWSDDIGRMVDKLLPGGNVGPRERITLHDNLIKHASEVASLMRLEREEEED